MKIHAACQHKLRATVCPSPPEQAGLAGAVGSRDQQVGARWHAQRQVVHQRGIAGGDHHRILKHDGVVTGQQLPRGGRQRACRSARQVIVGSVGQGRVAAAQPKAPRATSMLSQPGPGSAVPTCCARFAAHPGRLPCGCRPSPPPSRRCGRHRRPAAGAVHGATVSQLTTAPG